MMFGKKVYRVIAINKITKEEVNADVFDLRKDAVEAIKEKDLFYIEANEFDNYRFRIEKEIW